MPALRVSLIPLAATLICFAPPLAAQGPTYDFSIQGFSMKLRWSNLGTFGHIACPPFNPTNPGDCPPESVGLEYPAGSGLEHLWAGGLWIGGKPNSPARRVSVTFEGWAGPYYEFFPGRTAADTIWRVAQWAPKPPGWDAYWGEDLPYRPFADDNQYCRYTDTSVGVGGHVPLGLAVVHSSYTWSDPSAEGIHVIEYRITNTGSQIIDSAYVGLFFTPDFGPPYGVSGICYTFILEQQLVHARKHGNSTATPLVVALVYNPVPPDSVRWTFVGFEGPQTPTDDAARYNLISSGTIAPDPWPCETNPNIVLAFGPFRIHPRGSVDTDLLRVAFAYVSGPHDSVLVPRVELARQLYLQGTGTGLPPADLPVTPSLMQNYPNPFNAETRIEYALDSRSAGEHVTLTVYDQLGREVAVPVDGPVGPGRHTAVFRAAECSGGVYYYRLRAGSYVETKAMVLVK